MQLSMPHPPFRVSQHLHPYFTRLCDDLTCQLLVVLAIRARGRASPLAAPVAPARTGTAERCQTRRVVR
jgi:hypothetical protein